MLTYYDWVIYVTWKFSQATLILLYLLFYCKFLYNLSQRFKYLSFFYLLPNFLFFFRFLDNYLHFLPWDLGTGSALIGTWNDCNSRFFVFFRIFYSRCECNYQFIIFFPVITSFLAFLSKRRKIADAEKHDKKRGEQREKLQIALSSREVITTVFTFTGRSGVYRHLLKLYRAFLSTKWELIFMGTGWFSFWWWARGTFWKSRGPKHLWRFLILVSL